MSPLLFLLSLSFFLRCFATSSKTEKAEEWNVKSKKQHTQRNGYDYRFFPRQFRLDAMPFVPEGMNIKEWMHLQQLVTS